MLNKKNTNGYLAPKQQLLKYSIIRANLGCQQSALSLLEFCNTEIEKNRPLHEPLNSWFIKRFGLMINNETNKTDKELKKGGDLKHAFYPGFKGINLNDTDIQHNKNYFIYLTLNTIRKNAEDDGVTIKKNTAAKTFLDQLKDHTEGEDSDVLGEALNTRRDEDEILKLLPKLSTARAVVDSYNKALESDKSLADHFDLS